MIDLLTFETVQHFLAVLKIRTAATLEGSFVVMNIASMFIAIEFLCEPNSAKVACKLAQLCMHTSLMLDKMILALKLERTQFARKFAHILMNGTQMLVQVGLPRKLGTAYIAARRLGRCRIRGMRRRCGDRGGVGGRLTGLTAPELGPVCGRGVRRGAFSRGSLQGGMFKVRGEFVRGEGERWGIAEFELGLEHGLVFRGVA